MKSKGVLEQKGMPRLNYVGKKPARSIIKSTKPGNLEPVYQTGPASFSGWRNLLILGDNLPVLKTLINRMTGEEGVRLIYIDPPFATGREFNGIHGGKVVAYDDTLKGADYLEFLRERILLMREIMAEDASIYVHIDWKMGHYVRVLMDEIFGAEHFINDITRIKCNPKNFNRAAYGNIKDTILFYSKSEKYAWYGSNEVMTEQDIARLFPMIDKDGRRYTTTPLHAPGRTVNGPTGQDWKGLRPPKGRHWRYSPAQLTSLDNEGLIEWSDKGNPRKKIFADDAITKGKKRQDIWEFKDPPYPKYPTEKNLDMLKTIISASSKTGDIVLDAFCGSGTTLLAAEELGRRWIGIDSSKLAIECAAERFREYENENGRIRPYAILHSVH
ncbi:MAG: site-specific DNA-methyltransferase [Methanomassiliicoccales archaeon]